MEVQYLSIHRVVGIIGLPNETDVELLPSTDTDARALLTVKKEPYYLHMRRCCAFGTMLASAFVPQPNVMPSQPESNVRTRFDAAFSRTTISEDLNFDKPLLVIEVSDTVESVKSERLSDLDLEDFGFGLELFEQGPLEERAKEALEAAAAGLALAMPVGTTSTIETVGNVAYLIEPKTKKLLYSIKPSVSASHRSYSSMTEGMFDEATAYARSLRKEPTLETVARLLSQSMQATDTLQAFLTAWAGLEVFIDKTFKDTYEPQIYTKLGAAAASAATPFIKRLRDVMKGNYNTRDKFVVIASALDEHDADTDIELFKKLKDTRDRVHQMNFVRVSLPTDATRDLLRKYLRLHLKAKVPSQPLANPA
jgi:hypothetical protein